MSSWEVIVITAVIAAFAGAVIGARVARRGARRHARSAGRDLTLMREVPTLDDWPAPADPGLRQRLPALVGILSLTMLTAARAAVRATRRRMRRAVGADPAELSIQPVLDLGGEPASTGTALELRAAPSALSAAMPPLAPTVVRRADPVLGGPAPLPLPGAQWVTGPGRKPLARTPALEIAERDSENGPALLRVTTAAGDFIHPLPDEEGLRIGPEPADVVVPELSTVLLLGRRGFVWTVQMAGPADPTVTLDGVPLTSVAMPWTSNRRLTAGAITLTLENASPARASFEEPATDVSPDLANMCAARANAYGLAIGMGDGPYAAMLATAAIAAFDPRLLDPARGAALSALNVTLAVRDVPHAHSDSVGEGVPLVAIAGMDATGELRAATNFDVSVWAITRRGVVLLSGSTSQAPAALEVIPLDVRLAEDLGERPTLLLAAGAPTAALGRRLAGATTLKASPEQLARAVASAPDVPAVAAAAVLTRPLRGSAGTRWSG